MKTGSPGAAVKLFEGKRGPKPKATHESEDGLYGEIVWPNMEVDWLKKSPGYERRREDGVDRGRRCHLVVAPKQTDWLIADKCISPHYRARTG